MSEATGRAARRTVHALNHRVMCELEAAALACIDAGAGADAGADAGVRHVVLVDEAAFGDDETRAKLARHARAGVELAYVRAAGPIATKKPVSSRRSATPSISGGAYSTGSGTRALPSVGANGGLRVGSSVSVAATSTNATPRRIKPISITATGR